MHILIVSATHFEVQPLLEYLEIDSPHTGMNRGNNCSGDVRVDVLITGIGMVNTALMVSRYSLGHFDLVINAGVCGAFNKAVALGTVVNVTEDVLSEMGAEDDNSFLTYDVMGLPGKHIYTSSLPHNHFPAVGRLPTVKGITVNTVHGNEASIEKVKQLYRPDVESMEGAAFFAACKEAWKNYSQSGIQHDDTENSVPRRDNAGYIQLRAISNYVEKRDKSKWQMPLAIKNLNGFLIDFIGTI